MALISKKTPEQKAIEAGIKEQEREEAQARRAREEAEKHTREREQQRERVRQAFFAAPAGRARLAFEAEDHVFQCAIDVTAPDPAAVLNSVCHEGWELVNGSFVFVEEGQHGRAGQNTATRGKTVGYYLFRRSDANRRDVPNPWEQI